MKLDCNESDPSYATGYTGSSGRYSPGSIRRSLTCAFCSSLSEA